MTIITTRWEPPSHMAQRDFAGKREFSWRFLLSFSSIFRRSLSNLYEKRGTLKKRMSTDQAIKVNLQIVHLDVQHLDIKMSFRFCFTGHGIGWWLLQRGHWWNTEESQPRYWCLLFSPPKSALCMDGCKQSTFSCKYSAFSGLDCLTLGASREPLMEAHEAYQVSKRNLFFGNWNFILENEILLNNVSIFRFYAKSWQEREWNSENGPSDNFFFIFVLKFWVYWTSISWEKNILVHRFISIVQAGIWFLTYQISSSKI